MNLNKSNSSNTNTYREIAAVEKKRLQKQQNDEQFVNLKNQNQMNFMIKQVNLGRETDYDRIYSGYKDWPKALIIVISLRLGLAQIEPEYLHTLKTCFNYPQCVGILGGKPKFALYFVGYQSDQFIFLDPHYVQDVIGNYSELKSEEKRNTYKYLGEARKISIENLDPCIGIGFVLRNGNDLKQFESAFSPNGELSSLASFFKKTQHQYKQLF